MNDSLCLLIAKRWLTWLSWYNMLYFIVPHKHHSGLQSIAVVITSDKTRFIASPITKIEHQTVLSFIILITTKISCQVLLPLPHTLRRYHTQHYLVHWIKHFWEITPDITWFMASNTAEISNQTLLDSLDHKLLRFHIRHYIKHYSGHHHKCHSAYFIKHHSS